MKKKSYFTSGSGARKAFVSSFQDKTELNEVIDSNNESKIIDKIFHKSSENMSELENNSVSLTVTSPPYNIGKDSDLDLTCLLYTSPSPRDPKTSRMPSSA